MRYKNIRSSHPNEQTQELRRLWEVKLYDGDPNDPNVTIRTETVIALNAVEANLKCQEGLAERPKELHYVTYPSLYEEEDEIYRIDSPQEGPVGEKIVPTVAPPAVEDW